MIKSPWSYPLPPIYITDFFWMSDPILDRATGLMHYYAVFYIFVDMFYVEYSICFMKLFHISTSFCYLSQLFSVYAFLSLEAAFDII